MLSVATTLVTGYLTPPSTLLIHIYAGVVIACLIGARLIWGFTGTRTSRFSSFPPAIGRGLAELWSALRGQLAHRTAGHNPAGALMVYALLALLLAMLATGLAAYGGKEKAGPLAAFLTFDRGQVAKRLHSLSGYGLLGLIAAHLAGVVASSLAERQNLVRPMLTGWKRVTAPSQPLRARPLTALALIGLAGAAGSALWARGAALPGLGAGPIHKLAAYEKACGDCHMAFPPVLLPRASWAALMAHPDDHFGEDATPDPQDAAAIAAYLQQNASETSDLKAANYFRTVSASLPTRITATPRWIRIHHDLPSDLFKSKPVGSPANCAACHQDAATGRFAKSSIDVPH